MTLNPSDKALRIRKLIKKHPTMSDAEVARKIGMPGPDGIKRVQLERGKVK